MDDIGLNNSFIFIKEENIDEIEAEIPTIVIEDEDESQFCYGVSNPGVLIEEEKINKKIEAEIPTIVIKQEDESQFYYEGGLTHVKHEGEEFVSDDEEEIEEDEDDSEEEEDEEIDVVSLSNTRISPPMRTTVRTIRMPARTCCDRNAHTLPTNPSKQMQNHIQNEMASAITMSSLISTSKAVSLRLNGAIKRKRMAAATPAHGRRRTKRSRFSDLIDTDKRSFHNILERLRRVDLRNAFEDLRQLVPATRSHKAAKVIILKDATHYVRELHLKDTNLSAQLVALRREQDRLRTTLSHLRRIIAYKNLQQIL